MQLSGITWAPVAFDQTAYCAEANARHDMAVIGPDWPTSGIP